MKALTDTELKARTVRDYTRYAERAGVPTDAAGLERLAVADLELADAYDREVENGPAKLKPEQIQRQRATLDEAAAAEGAEIVTGRTIRREIAALHAKPRPGSKWSFAMGRLARILQRPNLPSRTPWEDCEIPHLAKRVYRIQAFVTFRHLARVGSEENPLHGLSDADFQRKFRRMIEDICDASSSKLGPWWVPK